MSYEQILEGRCPECSTTLQIRPDRKPYGYCPECRNGWRMNTDSAGNRTVDFVISLRRRDQP